MNDPTSLSSDSRRPAARRRWLLCGAALLAAAGMALLACWAVWKSLDRPETDPFGLPPWPSTPFLNTRQDARYTGSNACLACHEESHASYRTTGMGRSLAEVHLQREPPDGDFDHSPSKRRYQVRRKNGQLWHRELLLGPATAEEVLLAEYPVKYVVGSGRHSLTYLVEIDGFLVESPVTWYASTRSWRMSPGYDDAKQPGFQRGVGDNCLVCHAGRAESLDGSWHRMRIVEPAIGCERCHGPGSVHVAVHAHPPRKDVPATGWIDYTIVNPAHLSRERAEAICQQCHLRPTAVVPVRGRKLSDFRPGFLLEDFQHAWLLSGDSAMTVVGHVEQMHLSRCYQASGTLSCLTCHDPHDEPLPKDRITRYRSICLECHPAERCTVSAQRRQRESPDNNCVHCHMPSSPTEIPHLAFTHHRIGIHEKTSKEGKPPTAQGSDAVVLRSFFDLSRLSEVDHQRSEGLAYLEAADRETNAAQRNRYQKRALALLTEVRERGLRDAVVDVGLARLRFGMNLGDFLPYAESALSNDHLGGPDRCNALSLVADEQVRSGQLKEAIATLRQLTRLRRHPIDWLLLGDCEGKRGNTAAAVEAMTAAVRINPRLWVVHQHLADHHRRQGHPQRAAWHQVRAQQ
jgi:predicted CXXCH cytochrome family protein